MKKVKDSDKTDKPDKTNKTDKTDKIEKSVKVLFVSSELAPFSKVGGLGDVVGSLPAALRQAGADVRVLTPAYGTANGKGGVLDKVLKAKNIVKTLPVPVVAALGNVPVYCSVHETEINGVITYFLECPEFFRDAIYPSYVDASSVRPFALLSLAALELYRAVDWTPEVFHCHDWPTAIVPMALSWHSYYSRAYKNSKSVFTIHNLAHQGVFPPADFFGKTGIDENCFTPYGTEFYNHINLLKGAIIGSNRVTTVSPTYAHEIQTPLGGAQLDGVLRTHSDKLSGILNGIDTEYWNPETDKYIAANYSCDSLAGKAKNRSALLKKCSWDDESADKKPLVVCVSRLVEQKGFDLILPVMPRLASSGARYIFLGTGDSYIEDGLFYANDIHSEEVRFFKGYDEELAHLLYAGGDIFLMPSLFEPCGLSQMIAMRYGTVPAARAVGGLADTVFDSEDETKNNGFLFYDYSQNAMMSALDRAITSYGNQKLWQTLIKNGMNADFTWKKSALSYMDIYKS